MTPATPSKLNQNNVDFLTKETQINVCKFWFDRWGDIGYPRSNSRLQRNVISCSLSAYTVFSTSLTQTDFCVTHDKKLLFKI